MGATGWSFVVPYQADMAQVLEDLKQREFERGDYEKPGVEWECLGEFGILEAEDEAECDEIIAQYGLQSLRRPLAEVGVDGFRDWLRALDEARTVKTRDDLEVLQQFSSSGTSSILDISAVVPERSWGGLFPLTPEEQKELFGTEQPSQRELEAWQQRIPRITDKRLYGRGEGFYVVLYKDGLPEEIYIEGCSGD